MSAGSFAQAFSKACGFLGQRPESRLASRETPLRPKKFFFLLLFLLAKEEKEGTTTLLVPEDTTEDGAVAKSIKMIKDTVAGINFDKVVILKKDKKTNEQKALIAKLSELVNSYNFSSAINLIQTNTQFNNIKNIEFAKWQNDVQKNILFNEAISHIIASELSAIRSSFDKIKGNTSSTEE